MCIRDIIEAELEQQAAGERRSRKRPATDTPAADGPAPAPEAAPPAEREIVNLGDELGEAAVAPNHPLRGAMIDISRRHRREIERIDGPRQGPDGLRSDGVSEFVHARSQRGEGRVLDAVLGGGEGGHIGEGGQCDDPVRGARAVDVAEIVQHTGVVCGADAW